VIGGIRCGKWWGRREERAEEDGGGFKRVRRWEMVERGRRVC